MHVAAVAQERAQLDRLVVGRLHLEHQAPSVVDRVVDHLLLEQLGGSALDAVGARASPPSRHPPPRSRAESCRAPCPRSPRPGGARPRACRESRRVAFVQPPGGRVWSSPYQYIEYARVSGEAGDDRRVGHPVRHDVVVGVVAGRDLDELDAARRPSRPSARSRRSAAGPGAPRSPGSGRGCGRAGAGRSRAGSPSRTTDTISELGFSSGRHSHSPLRAAIRRPSESCTSGR